MTAGVITVDHPLVRHKLTQMRRRDATSADFRRLTREISLLIAYEVTRDLPTTTETIETPLARMEGVVLAGRQPCIVSILRAGGGMLEGMLELMPGVRIGHIGLYREPETLVPVEYYFKVPDDVAERPVIVVDPMLATGNSATAAVRRLKEVGASRIKFMCILAAPEGLRAFCEAHEDVPVYTAGIDEGLNADGFIVPGLGDAGDRLFGTL